MFTTNNFRQVFRFKVDIEDSEVVEGDSNIHIKPIPPILLQHLGIHPLRYLIDHAQFTAFLFIIFQSGNLLVA